MHGVTQGLVAAFVQALKSQSGDSEKRVSLLGLDRDKQEEQKEEQAGTQGIHRPNLAESPGVIKHQTELIGAPLSVGVTPQALEAILRRQRSEQRCRI